MPLVSDSLWALALSGQPIDATELASALHAQSGELDRDFRTELLIRDSLDALAPRVTTAAGETRRRC